jgi:hypothetical protein
MLTKIYTEYELQELNHNKLKCPQERVCVCVYATTYHSGRSNTSFFQLLSNLKKIITEFLHNSKKIFFCP